jgi:ubiquinone/menaquinone biosynthesis C-methylase UbiE
MAGDERPPVCDYEGSDYQSRFWEEGGREYEDRAEASALERLQPLPPGRWLEVGAGAGRNTARYRGFDQLILLDYSHSQLMTARERLGGGAGFLVVQSDIYHLPFARGTFAAATMIRTLHHMAEPLRALKEIRRVLSLGAGLLLEYPNKRNVKAILRWWLGRQEWNPFSGKPVEFARLNYNFHPRAVREWLRRCGFSIERELSVSHFRLNWLKRRLPLALLVALDAALQPTGRWWHLAPSVFLRARATEGSSTAGSNE